MVSTRRVVLAFAAASALMLGGCAGDERPWEAHLKDKDRTSDQPIPDLTPQTPTTPASPSGAAAGGTTPTAPPDPSAPAPNTGDQPAADSAGSESEPSTPERADSGGDDDAPARPNQSGGASGSTSTADVAPDPSGSAARRGSTGAGSSKLDELKRRQAAPAPTNRAQRIAADKRTMLDLRTMVSIIEGCNSGRQSYARCNTHSELGRPEILGLEIGRAPGQIRITASPRSFRLSAVSRSDARFTMARGPAGDRFSCLPGKNPGACPASRTWGWLGLLR